VASTFPDWLGLALVALVPLIALSMTSFVKISVVLSLLRNALGVSDAPSGYVVTAISLVLTGFVMAPVGERMLTAANVVGAQQVEAVALSTEPTRAVAAAPAAASLPQVTRWLESSAPQLQAAIEPLRQFLVKHSAAADRETFTRLAVDMGNPAVTGNELWVLAPAFVTTELKEAFALVIALFIPFLVIDIVVGLVLVALGLQSTPPGTVALPLKLLLFVAVDGWRLLIEGLLRGYA
jgi:type III secretion protein R